MPLYNGFFTSEKEARVVLHQEGKKLKSIADKIWRMYLQSYTPKAYALGQSRTGRASERSIKLGSVKRISPYEFGIEVTFDNDLTYHDSVIGSDEKQGHSIMLISEGWQVKSGKHKDVYRFGYYEGFDYIGKVKREYERKAHKGISLEVNWSGETLK